MRAGILLGLVACTGPIDDTNEPPAPLSVRAVTFNTGTTEGLPHGAEPDDGYTDEHALLSDQWYGDGLAWVDAIEATTAWFERVQPDVVGFQEMFFSDLCADIPEDARGDFVCEDWQPGDPTVAQRVLGEGWQIACQPGKDDKCAAVHERLGRFRGCDSDFCLEGLEGGEIDDCGSGSRVGRGVVELTDGGELVVVNVHGSSGLSPDDQGCRVQQIDQVFVDLGDGEPAVNGDRNLMLGDLNTDPGRWTDIDPSAARWSDFVGGDSAFQWHTEVGPDAPQSYQGVADIDHVASDSLQGGCWIAGLAEGEPEVLDAVYFDHRPVVCDLTLPR